VEHLNVETTEGKTSSEFSSGRLLIPDSSDAHHLSGSHPGLGWFEMGLHQD
jgi:hypothetical protein